jgi:L-aspartate oxidase
MSIPVPRYLVPFHPKRMPHFFTDVLIVGGGLAGLRAALAVDPALSAVVIAKDDIQQSNSTHAQGGIATVIDPDDRFENHIDDTLEAGGSLCDRPIVERVIREGPQRIQELIDWGTQFDHVGDRLALGREGGHSHHRIVHALGDATGREVMRVATGRVEQAANIDVWEHTFTLDLLTYNGICRGALVWNSRHGKTMVWAKQTILATGGAGQLYRETTNPDVATGDGMAIAYRAGAELRDVEFMQFHPTVLYIAGGSRHLISEATRGEGAWLIDRHGHRFMADYDPRGELAPRDVVSLAIVGQMEKTKHPNVYLDLTHLKPQRVLARFPGIAALCAESPEIAGGLREGRLVAGPLGAFLVARLSEGSKPACDPSLAQRTLAYDLAQRSFTEGLARLLGVETSFWHAVSPSAGARGRLRLDRGIAGRRRQAARRHRHGEGRPAIRL